MIIFGSMYLIFDSRTIISRNSNLFRPFEGAAPLDSTFRFAAMKVLSTAEILTYWSRILDFVAKSHMSREPMLGQDDLAAKFMKMSFFYAKYFFNTFSVSFLSNSSFIKRYPFHSLISSVNALCSVDTSSTRHLPNTLFSLLNDRSTIVLYISFATISNNKKWY